ncbi:DNA-processing protein DprA [Microlunatus sp. Gsoil 973]|uniref:DNA-processing protein DprA n=1 Tax=Microlunatus sp. Gsoil 973 TaxID=2672569 RepID=UPI0012B4D1B7|nr:DNA-processing protein DprA [Microlunatus sp. Gsoil 973]QGN32131.1 DNA-protecting protein DprA [Microlunatus sp. Gsoil 973]
MRTDDDLADPVSIEPVPIQPVPRPAPVVDAEHDRRARMVLSCVAEPGDPAISGEVVRIGAVEVLRSVLAGDHGPALAERAGRLDLTDYHTAIAAGRFRFIVPADPEWPERLVDLASGEAIQRRGGAPYGLWLRGPARLSELAPRSVAIVGSRASSQYGDTVAEELGYDLVREGWTVVSGGAFGIDAAAHRGALSASGPTVAVLACGVDAGYPPGNHSLFEAIAADHLLVSELPPGMHPTRVRFLARNRIIAAMTRGTIVVEAAIRSGARNTANWAVACNRQVMAVPGAVNSALSVTPHLMIREGQAALITNAKEALELLADVGDHLVPRRSGPGRPTDAMDDVRLAVFEAVPRRRYRTAGEVALAADVSMPRCLAELAALADAGLVQSGPTGWRLHDRVAGRARG